MVGEAGEVEEVVGEVEEVDERGEVGKVGEAAAGDFESARVEFISISQPGWCGVVLEPGCMFRDGAG